MHLFQMKTTWRSVSAYEPGASRANANLTFFFVHDDGRAGGAEADRSQEGSKRTHPERKTNRYGDGDMYLSQSKEDI